MTRFSLIPLPLPLPLALLLACGEGTLKVPDMPEVEIEEVDDETDNEDEDDDDETDDEDEDEDNDDGDGEIDDPPAFLSFNVSSGSTTALEEVQADALDQGLIDAGDEWRVNVLNVTRWWHFQCGGPNGFATIDETTGQIVWTNLDNGTVLDCTGDPAAITAAVIVNDDGDHSPWSEVGYEGSATTVIDSETDPEGGTWSDNVYNGGYLVLVEYEVE